MTAFRMKNTTGLTLEGGPVTVFEGTNYVGEAMLNMMRQDEESITPYSVELGVTVTRKKDAVREDYTRAWKSGTFIYKRYRHLLVTTYTFTSRLDRELDAFIDHRFQNDKSEDTPDPVEITPNFWRFRTGLEPESSTEFIVKEVMEKSESVNIENIVQSAIYQMFDQKLISEKTKKELEKIADKVKKIKEIEASIDQKENQETKMEKGQKRLRENLKALGNSPEEANLRQKYVSSLADEEEKIEQLRKDVVKLKRQNEQERKQLNKMIDKLEMSSPESKSDAHFSY